MASSLDMPSSGRCITIQPCTTTRLCIRQLLPAVEELHTCGETAAAGICPPPHLFRCVRGQGSIQQPTQLNIQVCFSAKRTYTKNERKNNFLYNIYINIIQGLSSLSLSFFFLGGGGASLRAKTTLYSSSSPTYGQVYCTHTSAPLNVVLYTLQDSCRPIRTREREREMSSQSLFKMSIEKRSRTSQLVSLMGNVIIVRRSSILYLFFSYFPVSGRKEPAQVSIRWRFPC